MFTVMRASHYQSIQKTHDFRERQLKNTSLQANMGLWTVVNWDIGTPASITKVPRHFHFLKMEIHFNNAKHCVRPVQPKQNEKLSMFGLLPLTFKTKKRC